MTIVMKSLFSSILKYDPNFGIDDMPIEETPDEEQ